MLPHQAEAPNELGGCEREVVSGSLGELEYLCCLLEGGLVGQYHSVRDTEKVLVQQDQGAHRRFERADHRRGMVNVIPPSAVAKTGTSDATHDGRDGQR